MPVALPRCHTIAPMCAIGRDSQTAISTGQGTTLGGSLLTGGVVTPASIAKPTGTLLTGAGGAVSGVATTPKPGGGRPGGPIKMLE